MTTDVRRLVWSTLVHCLCSLTILGFTPVAQAQNFEVLWGGTSGVPQDGNTWDTWEDWEKFVDLGGTGIERDRVVFLYQSDFGAYPHGGLHESQADPTWMARHHARILSNINTVIPDPSYAGLAIIDYESWGFSWGTTRNEPNPSGGPLDHDYDFKDDWRTYIRQSLPWTVQGMTDAQAEVVFKDRYNAAAKEFIVETIRLARILRPHAKWGYYLIPCRSYHEAQDPVVALGFQTNFYYEVGWWLYPEQTAFFPEIYSLYMTEADGSPPIPYRDHVSSFLNYLTYNIQWAIDAAEGRPVYPIICMRYHDNAVPYAGSYVNPINMQYPIRIAKQLSAQGVVIWDAFGSTVQAAHYEEFVDTRLRPFLRPFLDRCPADMNGNQAVTIDDLIQFLVAYEGGRDSADVSSAMPGQLDQAVTIDDLLFFLTHFSDGC